MPKAIIEAMKRGYAKSGLSSEEVNHRVYGRLNNIGALHGSKETDKGDEMESKYEADHGDEIEKALKRKKGMK